MRSHYLGPWRIDVERRDGVARLLPDAVLARTAAAALDAAGAPAPASLGLILADDAELAALNEAHMGKDGPTDVLSFPLLPPAAFPPHAGKADDPDGVPDFPLPPGAGTHLGDIVVSVERAVDQAGAGRGGQTGRRTLGRPRRVAAARDARRPPRVRLGPRRARGGGRDARG